MTADAKQRAWRLFIENSARIQTELDRRLRADGLCLADYHVLLLLHEAPGRRLRMNELSRRMVFSPGRLSYQVATLCKRGWLRRESAPEDRRGSYAVLTDAGASAFESAARTHGDDVDELFFGGVSDHDAVALAGAMHALADHLDRIEKNP
ncbi:MarR family winged helix-turn-helix transcriptional regulator [Gordonia neofelifaecis]|uniref:Putative MarR family transcriptional regulator n=1 Tax=Gordonia neofelifaecis NRRL B-59395 TaxID=644548 RepID=F1YF34_9ACTN|nr:MarR family transcriptional regulator [Gordonia neofelifaecis]EGD56374.1 putative MarR family transcriptional regulator [Gordonia neofelifaecis NRRL B-59395]